MATLIVGAGLAAVVVLAIISIVKKKKSGVCSCGADCGACCGCSKTEE